MSENNFVGTSYGGAEAAVNAVATGKDAILFNPASAAFGHYKLDETKYEGNMVSYIIDGEILNSIFKDLDRTPGEKRYLGEEEKLQKYLSWYLTFLGGIPKLGMDIYNFFDSLGEHGLSNFNQEYKNERE